MPAVITVTGTGDEIRENGLVTFREAITSTNSNADVNEDVAAAGEYGLDTIAFSIPRPFTNGLVSWWRGEGNPDDLIDGNSAVGRIGSPLFVAARYGQGMQFAGGDGFSVPDTSNPNLDFDANASFTIDAWVRVDGVPTNTSVLIEKRQQAGPTGYSLYLQGTSAGAQAGKLGFIIQTDNVSAFAAVDTLAPVAFGQFHHLAAVVNRSTETLSLFLDGVLQGSASSASVGDISNTGRFFIGHNSEDIVGSTGVPFNGVIDELGVSNRALSTAEVQAIATGVRTIRPTPDWDLPGLVARWSGEGDASDPVGGHDGVLTNGASFAPGKFGQAFSLDGVDDFIEVPDSPDFSPGAGSFTIEAWINQAGPGAFPDQTVPVVSKADADFDNGWLLTGGVQAFGAGGRADFVTQAVNDDFPGVRTADPVPLNTWVHLAGVRDAAAGEVRIYVNGRLSGREDASTVGSIDPTAPLFIGKFIRYTLDPDRDDFFPGLIDEVGYYNRALSDAEIDQLVNRPLPEITDSVVIDGYTQPGASVNTDPNGFNGKLLVELNGADAGITHGLKITAGNCTVRGLVINGFRGLGTFVGNAFDLDGGGGNHIEGNFIGTDPTGTLARGNEQHAVAIEVGSNNNVIGGTNPAARNVISASGRAAFFIATAGNSIQGNFIGTQRDGISPLGNLQGVGFVGVGGANNNLVGGTVPGAGNVIAFNDIRAVVGELVAGTGNSVLGNSIYGNGALGIDWVPVGPTPNDPGDADAGLNNLQNFPVLTSVVSLGGTTTIQGTLNSTPRTNGFRLEFFANNAADPSGFGEGQIFLGSKVIDTDASGNATFTLTVPTSVPVGQYVAATATDPAGNTSEFSQAVKVALGSGIVVSDVGVIEGNSGTKVAEFVVSLLGGTARPVTVHVATAQGTAAAGSDYYSAVQTLVFKPGGPTTQIVRVRVVGDRRVERDETFFLTVLYAVGATVVDRQGMGTIVNDDGTSHTRVGIDSTSFFDPNEPDWLNPWPWRTRK